MDNIIVRSRVWAEADLIRVQEDPDLEQELGTDLVSGNPDHNLDLPNGGVVLLGSTQPKKQDDARTFFRPSTVDVKVSTPIQLLHWFFCADEVSGSYTGNAYEKAQNLLERIYDHLGYEYVAARLKEQGISPDDVVFCVNDCGMHFNTDYSHEPEFERCIEKKGLGPWPGVELGPVLNAQGGVARFFLDLKTMTERKRAAGEDVDLSGCDVQFYLMFKLKPRREDLQFFSFEASVPIEFTTEPKAADPQEPLSSYNYIVPLDLAMPAEYQGKVAAEIGSDFIARYSAESYALREFIFHAQIPRSMVRVFDQARGKIERDLVIATQHNVLQPTGNSKAFEAEPDYGVHKGFVADRRRIDSKRSGAYQRLTNGSDAVVLGPHSTEILRKWDYYFPDLFDTWLSLVVDKQVCVETFAEKPFFVQTLSPSFTYDGKANGDLDWNDGDVERAFLEHLKNIDPADDPWGMFVEFTHYLHAEGFVKQQPKYLFETFEHFKKPVRKSIKRQIREAEEVTVPEYAPEEFGSDRTDLEEITILGSAGIEVKEYLSDARELGYWSMAQGWHVRTGGGRMGVMGAAAKGALAFMEEFDDEYAGYLHFSAIQMPRTLQFEGVCINPASLSAGGNKYLLVAPSFDTRMRSLFRSDVLVAMAGGVGTYQEINRFIKLKEAGIPQFQGKKMILVNTTQPGKPGQIRVFDPFLALTPARYVRDHLMVVPDLESAKREARRMMENRQNIKLYYDGEELDL